MHCAIYLSNRDNKPQFIQAIQQGLVFPELQASTHRIALFSKLALQQHLQEEYQHDIYTLTGKQQQSLASLSEGEQKKVLLANIIQQQPDVLIVDDVFDNLDTYAQQQLYQTLKSLALNTQLIQIVSRCVDKLDFIQTQYYWHQQQLSDTPVISKIATVQNTLPDSPFDYSEVKNPLISMRNIAISFADKKVINNLDWTVNRGEFWQLLGANGSGKTTLLRMLIGDNAKGFGQDLTLFGHKKGSGESVWDIKRYIGYFTSAMTLHFSRYETVENMLLSGFFDSVGLYQQAPVQYQQLTLQWLQFIGLQDKAKQAFSSLSLGHQRLLMVVRAMVKMPPLIILDEPLVGLDDDDIAALVRLINAVASQKQSAIIVVSHRQEQAIQAQKQLQLIPSEQGSTGVIVELN